MSGIDLVGWQRSGKDQDGLLAYRARLPSDQVRAQSGDYVVAACLLQLGLTLTAPLFGSGQGTLCLLPRCGGQLGGTLAQLLEQDDRVEKVIGIDIRSADLSLPQFFRIGP